MAEGLNTPQSAEEEAMEGNHVNVNGQLPNGGGGNMEVDMAQLNMAAGGGGDQSNDAVGSSVDGASGNNPEPEREITQTDHLNKSLLTSFLNRLNDPTTSPQFPALQSSDADFDDDEGAVIH